MKIGKRINLTPKWGSVKLSENKSFEYQFDNRFSDQPFEFSLSWTSKQDHAGIRFTFSIYKLFWIELSLYDSRHWNTDQNRWQSYEDYMKDSE